MENSTSEKTKQENMSIEEVSLILSRTIKDIAARRVTVRYALAVSRLAIAMAKTIEVVELKDRVELLERILDVRKKAK